MHELLWVTGLAGAVGCLAGHLPGPVRQWGPHLVALAVMLPMHSAAPPNPPLLAAVVAAAGVWNACTGCPSRRQAETVDLAAMSL
ncbi:hypothetical protein NGM37_37260, partial [Streptomyces sp. TRM76130]|nr:hypothetical protein [Streptomyces sp. TRM76130]